MLFALPAEKVSVLKFNQWRVIMVAIVEQLCVKSFEITAENGDSLKLEQGKTYTTTVPKDSQEHVTVFSRFWVPVPKHHFVVCEE